jgi:hypothetical protein
LVARWVARLAGCEGGSSRGLRHTPCLLCTAASPARTSAHGAMHRPCERAPVRSRYGAVYGALRSRRSSALRHTQTSCPRASRTCSCLISSAVSAAYSRQVGCAMRAGVERRDARVRRPVAVVGEEIGLLWCEPVEVCAQLGERGDQVARQCAVVEARINRSPVGKAVLARVELDGKVDPALAAAEKLVHVPADAESRCLAVLDVFANATPDVASSSARPIRRRNCSSSSMRPIGGGSGSGEGGGASIAVDGASRRGKRWSERRRPGAPRSQN